VLLLKSSLGDIFSANSNGISIFVNHDFHTLLLFIIIIIDF